MGGSPRPWLVFTAVLWAVTMIALPAASMTGRTPVNDDPLAKMIADANVSAIAAAQQRGASAVDVALPFLHDGDRRVRLIAVDAIAAAGGPKAPQALIEALSDTDEQVRIDAVNGLHTHVPSGLERQVLAAWDQSKDPFVRRQLPIVLGRTGNPALIPQLNQRLRDATAEETREGLVVGLAKLGDADARVRFGEMLAAARGEGVASMIEYVQYLNDPWVLPYLRPVLERKETARVIGTHVKTVIRRGCDLATDEVLRISGAKFSFAADPGANYTDQQLFEVERFLDQQKATQ